MYPSVLHKSSNVEVIQLSFAGTREDEVYFPRSFWGSICIIIYIPEDYGISKME